MRFFRPFLFSTLLFFASISFFSCPNGSSIPEKIDSKHPLFQFSPQTYFSPQTQKLKIHLFYEPNAAPEVSDSLSEDCWNLFRSKITLLTKSDGVGPDLYIGKTPPSELIRISDFHQMESQQKNGWKSHELYRLATDKEALYPNDNPLEPAFYFFFLNGYLLDKKGKPLSSILALTLSITATGSDGTKKSRPTPIIAVFKDAIRNHAFAPFLPSKPLAQYEQITLAHEMGHALGLVNKDGGIPMKRAHEDTKHPHHCFNESCIMFWSNESLHQLNQINLNSYTFCRECIDDVYHFKASLKKP